MRRWMYIFLLVLGGCGAATPDPTILATTGQLDAATPSLAPIATVAPPNTSSVLLTMRTTGGIAGMDRSIEIWNDGQVFISSEMPKQEPKTGTAAPEQLADLQALLADPAFQALDAQYAPINACCDLQSYELKTSSQLISTMDTAEYPPILGQVLDLVGAIAAGVQ